MNGIDLTSGNEGSQVIAAAMIFTTLTAFRFQRDPKSLTAETTVKDLDTAAQLASGLAGRIHNLNSQTPAEPAPDDDDALDALGAAV